MRRSKPGRALAIAALMLLAAACRGPAPTHALVVRHPERKCALIKFSGCALLLPPADEQEPDPDLDADAGSESLSPDEESAPR